MNGYSQESGGKEKNPYSSLIQVITRSVEYDSWMANGKGEGEILLMEPGILVVAQTRHVQEQVKLLLEMLRKMRQEMDSE